MGRAMRRLIIAVLFTVGVVALLPVLPNVLAVFSATVNVNNGGTYYMGTAPSPNQPTRYINCGPVANTSNTPANWTLRRGRSYGSSTQGIFQCTNNWGSDVSITITKQADPGAVFTSFGPLQTRTVPSGGTLCFGPTGASAITTRGNNGSGTVTYQVVAENRSLAGPKDLEATFYFAHTVTVNNTNSDPTYCTP